MTTVGGNFFRLPPPQPRRGSRSSKLIIVAIVAAVLCCGCGIGGFIAKHNFSTASGTVKDVVDEFVSDLENQHFSDAYGLLCADTRTAFTLESFTAVSAGLVKYSIDSVTVSSFDGHAWAESAVSMTYRTGTTQQRIVPLIKENDRWQICGHPY